jgi:hypothetical protein
MHSILFVLFVMHFLNVVLLAQYNQESVGFHFYQYVAGGFIGIIAREASSNASLEAHCQPVSPFSL